MEARKRPGHPEVYKNIALENGPHVEKEIKTMVELTKTHLIDVIKTADDAFAHFYKEAQFKQLAELYTPDGIVLPPNMDMIKGREAITGLWKAVFDMGIKSLKLETIEVEDSGCLCVEVGLFELYGANGDLLDKGKYMVTWRHAEGEWKLYRDIFNSSLPAQK
jgi:ketosteroid isomerase-like protein